MSKISREKKRKKKEELRAKGLLPSDFCESCHNSFPIEELNYGPNPFAHEIYGDTTETVLCKECYYQSCMDI